MNESEIENHDDWVEKIYYEGKIKVTRYKPSWHKEPERFSFTTIKGKSRKPSFGPKDP